MKRLSNITEFCTSAHPNAGLPNAFGEYDQTAEEMKLLIREYLESKCVNIIGGCCGTTPEHIKLIAEEANNFSPRNIV
jgi:5-methyltetrahydrofolate--homocysteine methyltransferase